MEEAAYIFNVTVHVEHSIAAAWVQWMKEQHIPQLMETGCFLGHRMVKLMEVDESEGLTYAIQYFLLSKALYNTYMEKHASRLRGESVARWGDKMIAFRTLMEVVQ